MVCVNNHSHIPLFSSLDPLVEIIELFLDPLVEIIEFFRVQFEHIGWISIDVCKKVIAESKNWSLFNFLSKIFGRCFTGLWVISRRVIFFALELLFRPPLEEELYT